MATTTASTPRPPAIMDHHQKPITTTTSKDQNQNQQIQQQLKCPRCDSSNTKFCYYNNYSLSQPRHFCKACKRYWTRGGTLRNVPVGGGCRKNHRRPAKRPPPPTAPSSIILSSSSGANRLQLAASSATGDHSTSTTTTTNNNNPINSSPSSISISLSSSVGPHTTLNNPLLYAPLNAELMINNNFPYSSNYYDANPNSATTSGLGLMGFLTGRSDLVAGNYRNACNFPSSTYSKQTIQDLISPVSSTGSFPNSSLLSTLGSNPPYAYTSTNTSSLLSTLGSNPPYAYTSTNTTTTLTSSTTTINNIITNSNLQSSLASTTQPPQFNFNHAIFPLEDMQQLKEGINQCGGNGHEQHDDGHMKMEDLTTNFHHQYGNTMSMTSHHHLVTSSSSSDPPILWNINNNTTDSISTTAAGTTTTTSTTAHDQFIGANWLSVDPYNNYSSMGSSSTSSLLPSFI